MEDLMTPVKSRRHGDPDKKSAFANGKSLLHGLQVHCPFLGVFSSIDRRERQITERAVAVMMEVALLSTLGFAVFLNVLASAAIRTLQPGVKPGGTDFVQIR